MIVDLAGKSVKDSDTLASLNVDKSGKIYFKDLGPQIGWSTVRLVLPLNFRPIDHLFSRLGFHG